MSPKAQGLTPGRENFSTWKVGTKANLISKGSWMECERVVASSNDAKTKNHRPLAQLKHYLWIQVTTRISKAVIQQIILLKLKFSLETKCDMNHKCETCAKGKSVRAPFNDKGTRAGKLLQIIHSDVCGPLSIVSYGGCTFIDDFSRKVFVYILKSKSEVSGKFVEFKTCAKRERK